uniref:Secreted protein n=1 Tax=Angiostrongylus cantonensis TaxID=6313 RepID=A0A0K0DCG2_ANGCA
MLRRICLFSSSALVGLTRGWYVVVLVVIRKGQMREVQLLLFDMCGRGLNSGYNPALKKAKSSRRQPPNHDDNENN